MPESALVSIETFGLSDVFSKETQSASEGSEMVSVCEANALGILRQLAWRRFLDRETEASEWVLDTSGADPWSFAKREAACAWGCALL